MASALAIVGYTFLALLAIVLVMRLFFFKSSAYTKVRSYFPQVLTTKRKWLGDRPLLYNKRDGLGFTPPLDDRFTNRKYRKYDEPAPVSTTPQSFVGLLPASTPETDAFVPSLEQAAERAFGTELGQVKAVKNFDLRGYSADEMIAPSDVVPFGQSTLAEMNGMGILQPSFDVSTLPGEKLLTAYAKNKME